MYKQEFEDIDGDTINLEVVGTVCRYVRIKEGLDCVMIGVNSIDKLITALQKIQGEVNGN